MPYPETHEPMGKKLDAAINRVDTPEFFNCTAIASGHNGVEAALLNTAEIRLLTKQAPDAVPRILARLEQVGGVKNRETRIAYFLIFRQSRDKRALPILAQYVDSLPSSDKNGIESPWHPFYYAVQAIHALVPSSPFQGSITSLFLQRHHIAAQVRAAIVHTSSGK